MNRRDRRVNCQKTGILVTVYNIVLPFCRYVSNLVVSFKVYENSENIFRAVLRDFFLLLIGLILKEVIRVILS